MYVIIGAGPAGLYAAIRLQKAGLRNIVIFDPRAVTYTRPGHLNHNAFQKDEEGIGVKFWSSEKHGHIKDLKRHLFLALLNFSGSFHDERIDALR